MLGIFKTRLPTQFRLFLNSPEGQAQSQACNPSASAAMNSDRRCETAHLLLILVYYASILLFLPLPTTVPLCRLRHYYFSFQMVFMSHTFPPRPCSAVLPRWFFLFINLIVAYLITKSVGSCPLILLSQVFSILQKPLIFGPSRTASSLSLALSTSSSGCLFPPFRAFPVLQKEFLFPFL